jgi:hypothetical protein
MQRRDALLVFAAAAAQPATAQNRKENTMKDILTASMNEKKGVTVHVNGSAIGMLVTKIGEEFVEGRSQQFSRIVVRMASIDAATLA